MPYHIKNLSNDSLQILWDVMEDLCTKSQLTQSGYLEVTKFGTEKVSPDDYKMVIWGLQKDRHIKSEWGSYLLTDSFVEFFNAVGDEMHDRIHEQKKVEKTSNKLDKKLLPHDKLRFDESGGELVVNGEHIKVISNKNFEEKLPYKLMVHILVKHKDEFFRKFSYIELLNSPLFLDFRVRFPKVFWRKCHDSFENLNKKIQAKTGFANFFKSGSKANGEVFINPDHLKTLGLAKPELG